MYENKLSRRQNRLAQKTAKKKARTAKVMKSGAAVLLATALLASGNIAALAATPTPTPSLGSAYTAAQMASSAGETITGVTGTSDTIMIIADMSDSSTILSVNTTGDDGEGGYDLEVVATGGGSGDWSNVLGSKFDFSLNGNAGSATVTGSNGNIASIHISLGSAPSVTPIFIAAGSSLGPAPIATKGTSLAVDDSYTLDVSQGLTGTIDVTANDTAANGYSLEPFQLIDPITERPSSSLSTAHVILTPTNTGVAYKALDDGFSGFVNVSLDEKEVWNGPGAEPAGWTAEIVRSQLSIHIIGKTPVAPVATNCTVPVAPMGGLGFSVPTAAVGVGNACNLVAVAGTVNIAPDATQATVTDVTAMDVPTNSTYSVDPAAVEFRAPDGTFAKDVVYPGQFEISYDSDTRITETKRLGTSEVTVPVLRRVTESKLDASGNKVFGGSASALLTVNVEAATPVDSVTKPVNPAPVVPETPVTPAPVVPETPVTPAPVGTTSNVPVSTTSDSASRPFKLLGDTNSGFGGPAKSVPAVEAANLTTRQGLENTAINVAGVLAFVIVLGAAAAGATSVSQARHRKAQLSDVAAQ